ncbi:hypothetical protein KP509_01G009500 [Ceratopteris richardii]|uniref:Uncharacterized protein n=1 Tax=Ceratopteris richardii TaxID=49495 RepID=A0A8T2VII2_CERRI|nr:hypothetical protein KP509_01G009500 [Ceratopteris richardii]
MVISIAQTQGRIEAQACRHRDIAASPPIPTYISSSSYHATSDTIYMTTASEFSARYVAMKDNIEAKLRSIPSVPSSSTPSGAGIFISRVPLPPRLVVAPPIFISPLLLHDVDGSDDSEDENIEKGNDGPSIGDEEVPIDPYAAALAICMSETWPLPASAHNQGVLSEDVDKSSESCRNRIRLGVYVKEAFYSALHSVSSTRSRSCPSPTHINSFCSSYYNLLELFPTYEYQQATVLRIFMSCATPSTDGS